MTPATTRTILVGVVSAALATSMAGCGSSPTGGSDGGSTTLYVTLANHVWTDKIKSAIPEFESQTGLKVELTQLGEDQLSAQYNTKLNSGTSEIDVMMFRPLQEGKMFAKNGWLADLSDDVTSDSAWNWSDFQAAPVAATTVDSAVVGVPIITEREVLYYRTDLLAEAGLKVPTTMDELRQAATTIHQAHPEVAGFVARTNVSAAVTQFSSFLYSYGGDFFDSSGKASLDTPEALAAYEMYSGLLHDVGPANVSTDMSWPDSMAIFQQGGAAFYTEADSLYTNATDAAKSKVADSVGFAQLPAGPAGSKPYNIPSWALGMNANSQNQANAWKFIQWATSKDMTLTIQQAGVPSARTSVWEDPSGISSYPKDLAAAIVASAKVGVGHDRPVVVQVAAAREIVGAPIVAGITGGDVAAAAQKAQTDFQAFLDTDK
ncbi:MAG: sugar ABC transporter substrate-binding protein [Propionibacteriaceae bacterium]|jgi:multiple sugar transport system substrate-binding protein|nr:sugar ABC transporter substrate-binding protein [Propionibacteriaceae bacterium]